MSHTIRKVPAKNLINSPISIWYSKDLNEYQIVVKGKPQATYFTENRDDAINTAQSMLDTLAAASSAKTLKCPLTSKSTSVRRGSGVESVDTLKPSRLFAFCQQFTHPAGWWMSAASGDLLSINRASYCGGRL